MGRGKRKKDKGLSLCILQNKVFFLSLLTTEYNGQTWPFQAQYRLHSKLQLWLIMQSKILTWAMTAYGADCLSPLTQLLSG